ncbi:hypothetical protein GCM10023093_09020 [Nemorincola caseinilytica]|uniref:Uncharacterized protein n=1 Tax=Nemorincola caseinilytica TaxID=2054315 RepID=A0ABP8N796_9BACT
MKQFITIASAICLMSMLHSCATIVNASKKGKTEVFLIDAPGDIQASSNGQSLSKTSEVFAANGRTNGAVAFYTTAVMLPRKKRATLELYSPSTGQKATVALKPKLWGKMVIADALLTAGIGWLIDGPTGNLLTLKPRLIDVPAAMAGKPRSKWRSQGKLKRQTKRGIKKG